MRPESRLLAALLALWFGVSLAVGLSGRMEALRPPAPQAVLALLTISFLAAMLGVPRLRAWTDQAPVRVLVALHLTRFVGFYFLVLTHRGSLNPAFAVPAGYGDILVSLIALALLLTVRPDSSGGPRLYFAWNVLGLADILFVVVTAARVSLSAPESMQALLKMPLCLLLTFLVPLIIASHVLLFRRLRAMRIVSTS